tara:strand:- start:1416 stop:2000 length:585 start_codon:yes stop_codon:yes gene_type:complete
MLSYKESLEILKATNALKEGHFILSSGLHSPMYVQCAQLLSKPFLADKICKSLSEKIEKQFKQIDLILSPAMGGIVIGYEVGRLLKKETIFSERVNGQFKLRRDFQIKTNQKVLIIEDVITTGKSILECQNLVEKNNAETIGYACLIDRSNNNFSTDKTVISQVKIEIPTYESKNLPIELREIKPVKPGSRDLK